MSNKIKPPEDVIDYFEALGFKYHVITDSIYMDKRDSPVRYFQTNSHSNTQNCSTLMADDAVAIFKNVKEPFSKRVTRAFGERCKNNHLLSIQSCGYCKNSDAPRYKGRKTLGASMTPKPQAKTIDELYPTWQKVKLTKQGYISQRLEAIEAITQAMLDALPERMEHRPGLTGVDNGWNSCLAKMESAIRLRENK